MHIKIICLLINLIKYAIKYCLLYCLLYCLWFHPPPWSHHPGSPDPVSLSLEGLPDPVSFGWGGNQGGGWVGGGGEKHRHTQFFLRRHFFSAGKKKPFGTGKQQCTAEIVIRLYVGARVGIFETPFFSRHQKPYRPATQECTGWIFLICSHFVVWCVLLIGQDFTCVACFQCSSKSG